MIVPLNQKKHPCFCENGGVILFSDERGGRRGAGPAIFGERQGIWEIILLN